LVNVTLHQVRIVVMIVTIKHHPIISFSVTMAPSGFRCLGSASTIGGASALASSAFSAGGVVKAAVIALNESVKRAITHDEPIIDHFGRSPARVGQWRSSLGSEAATDATPRP
jgi:hypothetical protein